MTRQEKERLQEIYDVMTELHESQKSSQDALAKSLRDSMGAISTVVGTHYEFVRERLRGIESHLEKLNGTVAEHTDRIDELDCKSNEVIGHVEKTAEMESFNKFWVWVIKHPWRSTAVFLLLLLGLSTVVHWIDMNNYLSKIIDWVIKFRFVT